MGNEFLILGIAFLGLFSITAGVGLLRLGVIIDVFPVPEEKQRTRSLSSPKTATCIMTGLCWILYIIGTALILHSGRLFFVGGITVLFSESLFLMTGLILSFAVIHSMRAKAKRAEKRSEILDLETALQRISKETGLPRNILLTRLLETNTSIPVQRVRKQDGTFIEI